MSKITKPLTALIPAYGRDYFSASEAKGDFLAGRDFIIRDVSSKWDGKPANIDAFASGNTVHIYYYQTKKSTVVKVP